MFTNNVTVGLYKLYGGRGSILPVDWSMAIARGISESNRVNAGKTEEGRERHMLHANIGSFLASVVVVVVGHCRAHSLKRCFENSCFGTAFNQRRERRSQATIRIFSAIAE